MELIVLGSGASAPARPGDRVRLPSGYAARLKGSVLLFDLGFGNVRQLVRAGLDPSAVSHVFLTHRHPDHVGDLAALLFLFRYDVKPRSGTLAVAGPPGVKRHLRALRRAHAPWLEPRGYRLAVRELDDGEAVRGQGWTVEARALPHFTLNNAYRLTSGGRSLVYTGDTGAPEAAADFARDCDLLLIECSQPERRPLTGHLTPRQALEAIEASGCRRALVTHVGEASERELERRLKSRGRRRPPVRVARDLERVRL